MTNLEFKVGQSVICEIDVYRSGNYEEYDGYITYVGDDKVNVCYLEGYKSRDDMVSFESIVALVDDTRQCEMYNTRIYSGHLIPNPGFKTKIK